ncbi:anti-phage dCTP deaminase [Falsiroseomonas sp. CW058]|uniref:anti-phage dCTP deaminase n=1 Tax=Falsiroseomonas sp. CW058 TaxID=3388664 RepID=UPI003D317B28
MSASALPAALEGAQSERPLVQLSDRRTEELVIGLVGAVGSGVSKSAGLMAEIMGTEYGYTVHSIRVSEIIREAAPSVGISVPPKDVTLHERIRGLQKVGNILRNSLSRSYLAEKCVEKIAVDRKINAGYVDVGVGSDPIPVGRRRVHIIDSLKHPSEVDLLRDVYGDTFWLIGVFAPESVRVSRLKGLGHAAAELSKTIEDDESDGLPHGQKVRDTAHQADFFVRNDSENDVGLRKTLGRFLKILFNVGMNTPTRDETAMDKATAQASNSACMSRQVGAAIYSEAGELIGIGANDVPKAKGGLYCTEDDEHDHRCFKWRDVVCHNDQRKQSLYRAIHQELRKSGLLTAAADEENITKALKKTDVKNLIEYSRAVHAEMEAILSVARAGKSGLVGSILYSTTFPCHSCARHAVASGIIRVVYIEPYAKSLATDLHGDSVSVSEADLGKKLVFLQYEGVAPKNMIRLFKHGHERKADGRAVVCNQTTAIPVFPAPLDGFSTREKLILDKVRTSEQRGSQRLAQVGG